MECQPLLVFANIRLHDQQCTDLAQGGWLETYLGKQASWAAWLTFFSLSMMDHQTTQVLTKHVSSTSNKGYLRETLPPKLTAL